MINIKKILIFTMLLAITFTSFAQITDVVYLKNGSVIKGEILELKAGEYIKIKSIGDNIWVIDMDDVEKFNRLSDPKAREKDSIILNMPYKGSFFSAGPGLLIGQEENGPILPFYSFLLEGGYNLKNGLAFIVISGIETMDINYLAVMGGVKYYLMSGKFNPHLYFRGGTAFGLESPAVGYKDQQTEPSIILNPGIGIQMNLNRNNSIVLSLGYRYQKNVYTYTDYNSQTIERIIYYNRLEFRIAYLFSK